MLSIIQDVVIQDMVIIIMILSVFISELITCLKSHMLSIIQDMIITDVIIITDADPKTCRSCAYYTR